LFMGRYDWTEKFIDTYFTVLKEEEQLDQLNFNTAKLEFARGNFRKVIPMLREVDYSSVFMLMDSRVLLLKTWYELGEWEAFEALLDSFNQLVSRNKLLSYHRENYLNLVQILRQLLKLDRSQKKRLLLLQQKIEATSPLIEKPWILEKIAAIDSKGSLPK